MDNESLKDVDEALNQIMKRETIQERIKEVWNAYETKMVKRVAALANVGDKEIRDLSIQYRNLTGKSGNSFALFYDRFPDFPMWLAAHPIVQSVPMLATRLISKFVDTPMYEGWDEAHESAPDPSKPVGFIFDWRGITGGNTMLLHNSEATVDIVPRTRVVMQMPDGQPPLILEQMEPFMTAFLNTYWCRI